MNKDKSDYSSGAVSRLRLLLYYFILDNEEYSNEIYFNDVTNLAPTTVYVRMNGTEVGQYDGAVEVSCSDSYLDTSVTLSGNVTEQGQGGEWNRILSLADLHDGDQVII
ncbi:MAG: hypothetical protein IKZ81_07535, partial [Clostridia bacterium]|nr:hypothetical protein [Clostridia bacterium]